MFEPNKKYTVTEISKISGVYLMTIYGRIGSRGIEPVQRYPVKFTGKQAEDLIKRSKLGRKPREQS